MQVVEALDAGAMYKKGVAPITSATTGGILHDKLSIIGADLMSDVLKHLNTIIPEEQDESLVTYAAKLDKAESLLDFTKPAEMLERKIRAFNPFPAMFFEYNGERFKVLTAEVVDMNGNAGQILDGEHNLIVACGAKALKITEIQRQGKKAMPIADLLRGFSFVAGTIL